MRIAEFQEETVTSRKKLASSTKTFKAKLSAEASKEVGPLLKAYQAEVDRLTRRHAFVSAFIIGDRNIYAT